MKVMNKKYEMKTISNYFCRRRDPIEDETKEKP